MRIQVQMCDLGYVDTICTYADGKEKHKREPTG